MSTVSKLPGRVRLEDKRLLGNKKLSHILKCQLMMTKGVLFSEVNHRTGRIFVVFDEKDLDNHHLLSILMDTIRLKDDMEFGVGEDLKIDNNSDQLINFLRLALDIAGHMLMPKPLGFLVPFAISMVRKKNKTI